MRVIAVPKIDLPFKTIPNVKVSTIIISLIFKRPEEVVPRKLFGRLRCDLRRRCNVFLLPFAERFVFRYFFGERVQNPLQKRV